MLEDINKNSLNVEDLLNRYEIEKENANFSKEDNVRLLLLISKEYTSISLEKSESSLISAILISLDIENDELIAEIFLELTKVQINLAKFEEAIKNGYIALEKYELLDNKKGVADSKRILAPAIHLSDNKKQDIVLNLCKESETLYNEIEDKEGLLLIYNSFAIINLNLEKYDQAIYYFEKALKLNNEEDVDKTILLLTNLGVIYLKKGSLDIAEEKLEKALSLCNDKSLSHRLPPIYANFSLVYEEMDRCELVETNLLEGLKISEKINDNSMIIFFYKKISEYYEKHKKFEMALKYSKLSIELNGSIFSKEKERIISDTIVKYKTQKKEDELELEKEKNIELLEINEKLKESHTEIIELEKNNSVLAMIVTANHEINQPLTVLSGNVELIKSFLERDGILNPEYNRMFDRSIESIDKIAGILRKYRKTNNISFGNYTNNTRMVLFGEDNKDHVLSKDEFNSSEVFVNKKLFEKRQKIESK